MLVALAGIVPVLIMRGVFLNSYEKCAVRVRTAEIQNQCTILSNQLSSSGYLTGDISEVMRTELVQLSNIYSGRVMVIDGAFKIQEDTYDMDKGKTIVSGNVIRCFQDKGTSEYNRKNRYIEVTAPIIGKDDAVVGVLLVSAPTDSVLDSLEILRNKADVVALATILVIMMIAVLAGIAMLKPFRRITESISAVTEGYDDNYLHENTYTETIELSEAFNKMSGRMKTLDDSKNEFVSNVSHELKTPIALIQGYAEGLKEGISDDPESMDFYCDVIIDEAGKMNNMVKKLLTLNQIEFGNEELVMERFDIIELITSIVNANELRASQKGIQIEFNQRDEQIDVWSDEYKIEEVVTNYITNAINHCDFEKRIEVSVERVGDDVRVHVFNTGKNIPEEDIPNIWQKFYKVDKARTREYGGNGIGLSIVKAIMDSYGKGFGVINKSNGVEFWFDLDGKAMV